MTPFFAARSRQALQPLQQTVVFCFAPEWARGVDLGVDLEVVRVGVDFLVVDFDEDFDFEVCRPAGASMLVRGCWAAASARPGSEASTTVASRAQIRATCNM